MFNQEEELSAVEEEKPEIEELKAADPFLEIVEDQAGLWMKN